mgnify:CR=1 FL=1
MTIDAKHLINWVGGKRLLRKIISNLAPDDIQTYIEPFGGGGWVLFFKDRWADVEIYNDLDGRLVNLFRIVKYHPNALKEELSYLLGSREMFMQFMNLKPITDVQKAAQFFFLITRSFGDKGSTFRQRTYTCIYFLYKKNNTNCGQDIFIFYHHPLLQFNSIFYTPEVFSTPYFFLRYVFLSLSM